MKKDIEDTLKHVTAFNERVKNEAHFELQVYSFSPRTLILAGNYELDYAHTVELHFEDVLFFCGAQHFTLEEPSTAPLKVGVKKLSKADLAKIYEMQEGYQIFIFETSEGNMFIAAKEMVMIEKSVLYYRPEKLSEDQFLAYWLE